MPPVLFYVFSAITLGFGLVKILLIGLVGIVAIVLAPVLFVTFLLIGLPLLILGCIFGCCAWAFAAAV